MKNNMNRSLLPGIWQAAEAIRIRHYATSLNNALQNYPLQRLFEQAKGKAIESSQVQLLEERATKHVLIEIRRLVQVAESIPDRGMVRAHFRSVIPTFMQALVFRGGEWSVRRETVRALGTIWGDEEIIPLLSYVLENDRTMVVRKAAAIEVSNISGIESAHVMVQALAQADEPVREVAIAALSSRPERRYAIPALEAGLRDPNPQVRWGAGNVLDEVEWEPRSVEDSAWHIVAKQEWDKAAEARQTAVDPLMNAMCGKNGRVREAAAIALSRMGWEPNNQSTKAWYLTARGWWSAVADMRSIGAEALVNAITDSDPNTRESASRALKTVGRDALTALIATVRDSRDAAVLQACSKLISGIAIEAVKGDPFTGNMLLSAIQPLAVAVQGGYKRVLLEPVKALADIAEAAPDKTQIPYLYEPVFDVLKDALRDQHYMVKQAIEADMARIMFAGRMRRPVRKADNRAAVAGK